MRIAVVNKGKPYESIYIQKDLYLRDVRGKKTGSYNGKERTTVTVEKLGKVSDLMNQMNMTYDQVIEWARNKAVQMTEQEKTENERISISYSVNQRIPLDRINSVNCGYLFLQSILSELRIDNICRNIRGRHNYDYNIEEILSDLVYARVLQPCSKRASYDFCQELLEKPSYEPHHVYRALSVLAQESDYIQAEMYKNSNHIIQRNNRILYYDCTNYYFETEEADGFREYGKSKEHRPNPIVQMGMFMDGDGIPLSFSTFKGSSNEQPSMKPLEKKIIRNFGFDQFVVCTDAGLGSDDNRQFNDIEGRAFITTQSLKKLKKKQKEEALSDNNWKRVSDDKAINITEIRNNPQAHIGELYYKEEPYSGKLVKGQMMLVTYSPKYAIYQKNIRDKQLERAERMIKSGNIKKDRKNPNDPARFITKYALTSNGEVAEETLYELDENKIAEEALFDGFYAVCTDLVCDSVKDILSISEQRWEIEECFRIMKTEFKARPVYVSTQQNIEAHFLICFLALLVYRLLEKKTGCRYTVSEMISTLRDMKLTIEHGIGYKPSYTRTEVTDTLHDTFGFYTDYELITKNKMRSIVSQTKMKTKVK